MAFAPLVVLGLTLGLALPPVHADVLFSETFDNGIDGWTTSDANKGESKYDGKWDVVVEPSTEEFPAENRVLVVSEVDRQRCPLLTLLTPLLFHSLSLFPISMFSLRSVYRFSIFSTTPKVHSALVCVFPSSQPAVPRTRALWCSVVWQPNPVALGGSH